MSALIVTGAGTDIGKTYLACRLIEALRARGQKVDAFKPVISGFEAATPEQSDSGRLLAALGAPINAAQIARISPWRFSAPLAADQAAAREGKRIVFDEVLAACRARIAEAEGLLLIEGAGGIMSPLSEDTTFLDLFAALGAPVVIVGGSYLGAISHTATAVAAARARGLPVRAVIVSESNESVGLGATREALMRLDPNGTYLSLPRGEGAAAIVSALAGLT
jgi:dethiobiotin synthetase